MTSECIRNPVSDGLLIGFGRSFSDGNKVVPVTVITAPHRSPPKIDEIFSLFFRVFLWVVALGRFGRDLVFCLAFLCS